MIAAAPRSHDARNYRQNQAFQAPRARIHRKNRAILPSQLYFFQKINGFTSRTPLN
jgi:hypothetical protein